MTGPCGVVGRFLTACGGGTSAPYGAVVFLAVFALYLGGASPAIAPRDAGDMAAAALTLGVAHPPGYPLYAALGKAWLLALPLANPAYRLALLSAAAGAGAAALLFAFVRRRAGLWAGVVAAAVWALSGSLWKFALIQEKYALHALAAAALLLLSEGRREDLWRRARLSGFLAGLALVNHQSLLLWLPGLVWLWQREAGRRGATLSALLRQAAPWVAAGLSLYVFLLVRLEGLTPALETALRLPYGTFTLSAGLSRSLPPTAALQALGWSLKAWAEAAGWPAAVAALAALPAAWREDRGRTQGLLLGALGAGPFFVLLSRFDPSDWVARSVLEPAFLLPALTAAALAGEWVGRLGPRRAAVAAALLAAVSLLAGLPVLERRDDFLAWDYVRNLRRAVPPGGALLTAGDTALFAWRWLELCEPSGQVREIAGSGEINGRSWLAGRTGRRDLFVSGMGLEQLAALGLGAGGAALRPEGLVQRVSGWSAGVAPVVLRRSRGWARGESYARDLQRSYAFAFWLSARLLETSGRPAEELDMTAVMLDPHDFQLGK